VGWKKGAAVDRHVARMMDQRSELTVQENEGKQRERVTFPGTNVVVKTKVPSKQKVKAKRMLAKKRKLKNKKILQHRNSIFMEVLNMII